MYHYHYKTVNVKHKGAEARTARKTHGQAKLTSAVNGIHCSAKSRRRHGCSKSSSYVLKAESAYFTWCSLYFLQWG